MRRWEHMLKTESNEATVSKVEMVLDYDCIKVV